MLLIEASLGTLLNGEGIDAFSWAHGTTSFWLHLEAIKRSLILPRSKADRSPLVDLTNLHRTVIVRRCLSRQLSSFQASGIDIISLSEVNYVV